MQSIDLSQWSERSLKRFKSLLDRERDAELFPDLALSAEECRELELFRLGGAERRLADAPPPLIRMAYANGILVVVERTIVDPVEEDTPPPRTITPDPTRVDYQRADRRGATVNVRTTMRVLLWTMRRPGSRRLHHTALA